MLFNSITFLWFFAAVLAAVALVKERHRNGVVLAASFLFYASWSPGYIALLLVTAMVDYHVALKMAALPKERRKPWLVFSLIFSLGSLAFFKYTNMALGTVGGLAAALGSSWRPPLLHIVLPLGISFYTFETISYGVDVYRGELSPKKSFFEYLSFLMFFPKIIAGPIARASELLHQIPQPRVCRPGQLSLALNLVAIGFAKKVLLADNIAPLVEEVYQNPLAHHRWMCLAAFYGYTMQVYLDFSAYTDIARGCSKLLGYELPMNFNQPYLATSIADFWRRWHMTLSRWLRDYLYIPLGGSKAGRAGTYRNLFLTMLLGGLWHGAAWTFVTWGAINGAFLLIERAWYDLRGTKPKRLEQMGAAERFARRFVVFHLIAFTRIFFRSPDFRTAIDMLHALVSPKVFVAEPSFGLFAIPVATVLYLLLSRYKERALRLEARGPVLLAYAAVGVALLVFGASKAQFIYFQF